MNYLLTLSYDGSKYCGWQIQPDLHTVQGELENALKEIFKTDIKTTASGRTDTGVSALGQTVNFHSNIVFKEYSLLGYLNQILPKDIRVLKVNYVDESFNARFDSKKKTYAYNFYLSRIDVPYLDKFATRAGYNIDIDVLERELKSLVGEHDFTSLSSVDTQTQNKVRVIYETKLIKTGEIYTAYFTGSGFLKNMIRIIMGTLFDIARGKIKCSILDIIAKSDRKCAGKTASPNGLVLLDVNYFN